MKQYTVRSFGELAVLLAKHSKGLDRAIKRAIQKTARQAVKEMIDTAPVAFGELRDSLDWRTTSDGAEVVSDAPYVLAVERGSRPHTPPLGPLVAWVKLKGQQGISRTRGRRRAAGAKEMAAALKAHEQSGALDVNAPFAIARAIQRKIAEHGTRPTHFVAKALPEIKKDLDTNIKDALDEEWS